MDRLCSLSLYWSAWLFVAAGALVLSSPAQAAAGEGSGPGCRAWAVGRTAFDVNAHGVYVDGLMDSPKQGLSHAQAEAEAAGSQVTNFVQGSCSVSGLGTGSWEFHSFAWGGGWFKSSGTGDCYDPNDIGSCTLRRDLTYKQNCSVGGPVYDRAGAVTVTRQAIGTYSEDCGEGDCSDLEESSRSWLTFDTELSMVASYCFTATPTAGGSAKCTFERLGLNCGSGAMAGLCGYEYRATGDACTETPDPDPPDVELEEWPTDWTQACRIFGSDTACIDRPLTGLKNCGSFNGQDICVDSVPDGACVTTPNGGVVCAAGSSHAPTQQGSEGPEPQAPDFVMSGEKDGQVKDVEYYGPQKVSESPTAVVASGGNAGRGDGEGEGGPGGSADGGATCDAPPVCSGDPVNCAILDQAWRQRCPGEVSIESIQTGIAGIIGEGNEGPAIDEVELTESLDSTLFSSGGGVCPEPITFQYFGETVSIPLTNICNWAGLVRPAVLAIAAFLCVGIVFRRV